MPENQSNNGTQSSRENKRIACRTHWRCDGATLKRRFAIVGLWMDSRFGWLSGTDSLGEWQTKKPRREKKQRDCSALVSSYPRGVPVLSDSLVPSSFYPLSFASLSISFHFLFPFTVWSVLPVGSLQLGLVHIPVMFENDCWWPWW